MRKKWNCTIRHYRTIGDMIISSWGDSYGCYEYTDEVPAGSIVTIQWNKRNIIVGIEVGGQMDGNGKVVGGTEVGEYGLFTPIELILNNLVPID